MKQRKNLLIILVLLFALAVSLMGTLFAYMYKQTEEVTNTFVPAQVDCEVQEVFYDSMKTSITVKNTGNIDTYLRVRLVSYWVNAENEIMPISSHMPSFTPNTNWIKIGEDTYYYMASVAPNEATTADLLDTPIILKTSAEGYLQVVEVFAEAIQAAPKDAVEAAWPVVVNNDGTLRAKS